MPEPDEIVINTGPLIALAAALGNLDISANVSPGVGTVGRQPGDTSWAAHPGLR